MSDKRMIDRVSHVNRVLALLFGASALFLSGCGFQPVYATREGQDQPGLLNAIEMSDVNASPSIAPVIREAFELRKSSSEAASTEYFLAIKARESAQNLAVQLDASVTRFNYIISGTYQLRRARDQKTFTGKVSSVVSFNVVNSQYSTLYAEQKAREKAARQFIEAVERDILLSLQDADDERDRVKALPPDDYELEIIDGETQ
ncbi:MAG: hypothetical protein AAF850_10980 [Pseudomonadota bacterium]